eukprot:Rhum_TRINITY_DN15428_c24_g1::Rhum_TRINITY_DN15428_c24_g1_i1::g.155957::m.155957
MVELCVVLWCLCVRFMLFYFYIFFIDIYLYYFLRFFFCIFLFRFYFVVPLVRIPRFFSVVFSLEGVCGVGRGGVRLCFLKCLCSEERYFALVFSRFPFRTHSHSLSPSLLPLAKVALDRNRQIAVAVRAEKVTECLLKRGHVGRVLGGWHAAEGVAVVAAVHVSHVDRVAARCVARRAGPAAAAAQRGRRLRRSRHHGPVLGQVLQRRRHAQVHLRARLLHPLAPAPVPRPVRPHAVLRLALADEPQHLQVRARLVARLDVGARQPLHEHAHARRPPLRARSSRRLGACRRRRCSRRLAAAVRRHAKGDAVAALQRLRVRVAVPEEQHVVVHGRAGARGVCLRDVRRHNGAPELPLLLPPRLLLLSHVRRRPRRHRRRHRRRRRRRSAATSAEAAAAAAGQQAAGERETRGGGGGGGRCGGRRQRRRRRCRRTPRRRSARARDR